VRSQDDVNSVRIKLVFNHATVVTKRFNGETQVFAKIIEEMRKSIAFDFYDAN